MIGDGAPWIWNQANLRFGDSHQVVDWYHAKDHLAVAVEAERPATPAPACPALHLPHGIGKNWPDGR